MTEEVKPLLQLFDSLGKCLLEVRSDGTLELDVKDAKEAADIFCKHVVAQLRAPPFDWMASFMRVAAIRMAEWDHHKLGEARTLFHATEFAGEAGEVANIVKKLERARFGLKGSTATWEELAEEIADAFICLINLANVYNIDLRKVVTQKFNATSMTQGFDVLAEYPK